jgi:hypothetical protein
LKATALNFDDDNLLKINNTDEIIKGISQVYPVHSIHLPINRGTIKELHEDLVIKFFDSF